MSTPTSRRLRRRAIVAMATLAASLGAVTAAGAFGTQTASAAAAPPPAMPT
jgi:hypothetical protein